MKFPLDRSHIRAAQLPACRLTVQPVPGARAWAVLQPFMHTISVLRHLIRRHPRLGVTSASPWHIVAIVQRSSSASLVERRVQRLNASTNHNRRMPHGGRPWLVSRAGVPGFSHIFCERRTYAQRLLVCSTKAAAADPERPTSCETDHFSSADHHRRCRNNDNTGEAEGEEDWARAVLYLHRLYIHYIRVLTKVIFHPRQTRH